MRKGGVVVSLALVSTLAACGRTGFEFDSVGGDDAGDAPLDASEFRGVAVRHITWSGERTILAPDDGAWLVFGAPPPSCDDPVVSGGSEGWHIATYIPPAELDSGTWDYADSGHLQPDAHQAWFLSWRRDVQFGEQLDEGRFTIDALDDDVVHGSVEGIRMVAPTVDVPDPEAVDGEFTLTRCP